MAYFCHVCQKILYAHRRQTNPSSSDFDSPNSWTSVKIPFRSNLRFLFHPTCSPRSYPLPESCSHRYTYLSVNRAEAPASYTVQIYSHRISHAHNTCFILVHIHLPRREGWIVTRWCSVAATLVFDVTFNKFIVIWYSDILRISRVVKIVMTFFSNYKLHIQPVIKLFLIIHCKLQK